MSKSNPPRFWSLKGFWSLEGGTLVRPLGFTLIVTAAAAAAITPKAEVSASFDAELMADRADVDAQIHASSYRGPLFLRRSSLNLEMGDFDGAMRDLDRALRFGAAEADVLRAKTRVHLDQGRPDLAVETSTAVLELLPGDLDATRMRAKARAILGEHFLAADDFGGAITLSPRRPLDLVAARTDSLLALDGSDPTTGDRGRREALATLDEEIARAGSTPYLELKAADIERSLGEPRKALSRFSRLRAQGWGDAPYGLHTGDTWLELGETANARQAWSLGLSALDSKSPRRRTTRGATALRNALLERLEKSEQ